MNSFDIVAVFFATKSNFASRLLPVASTLLLVWTGLKIVLNSTVLYVAGQAEYTNTNLRLDEYTITRLDE